MKKNKEETIMETFLEEFDRNARHVIDNLETTQKHIKLSEDVTLIKQALEETKAQLLKVQGPTSPRTANDIAEASIKLSDMGKRLSTRSSDVRSSGKISALAQKELKKYEEESKLKEQIDTFKKVLRDIRLEISQLPIIPPGFPETAAMLRQEKAQGNTNVKMLTLNLYDAMAARIMDHPKIQDAESKVLNDMALDTLRIANPRMANPQEEKVSVSVMWERAAAKSEQNARLEQLKEKWLKEGLDSLGVSTPAPSKK